MAEDQANLAAQTLQVGVNVSHTSTWRPGTRRGKRPAPEPDDLRAAACAFDALLAPGPIPLGQSIGIDDGRPGRKSGLVSSDAD